MTVLSTARSRHSGINVGGDYRRVGCIRGVCRRAWEHARGRRDMTPEGHTAQTPSTAASCTWSETCVRNTAWRLFKVQVGHSLVALLWKKMSCPREQVHQSLLFRKYSDYHIHFSFFSTTLEDYLISWDRQWSMTNAHNSSWYLEQEKFWLIKISIIFSSTIQQ